MARLYFHCSSTEATLVDPVGVELSDLGDACTLATRLVRSYVASPSLEDWRSWILHVWDDLGEELFSVPFASALGRPN